MSIPLVQAIRNHAVRLLVVAVAAAGIFFSLSVYSRYRNDHVTEQRITSARGKAEITNVQPSWLALDRRLPLFNRIVSIHLEDRTISKDLLFDLGRLNHVTRMDLQRIRAQSSGATSRRSQHTVRWIDLSGARIDDDVLGCLGGFKKLESLNLNSSPIGDRAMQYLAGATQIDCLSLRNTRITDRGLEALRNCVGLTELKLSNTTITDEGLQSLRHMKKLRRLFLAKTRITDAGLEALQEMTSVDYLSLANTRINGSGLKHLSNLRSIGTLELNGTDVNDDAIKYLAALHGWHVYLEGTRITPEGLERLRNRNPETTYFGPDSDVAP